MEFSRLHSSHYPIAFVLTYVSYPLVRDWESNRIINFDTVPLKQIRMFEYPIAYLNRPIGIR